MSELKRLMTFRENITHFTDQAPDRTVIDQILRDAHELVPVKNNMWNYHIDVYGPEHDVEKKQVAMQTITGYNKSKFAPGNESHDDVDQLSELYDGWKKNREILRQDPKQGGIYKYHGYSFNDQVRAPYLLVYYQRPGTPTEKQMEKGYRKHLINYSDNSQWMISASMHGYGTTLLCAEQKLYASFCKCYYRSYVNFTNILAPLKHGFENVAFLLGIGYRDNELPYYKNVSKPDYGEIVNWK
jgi:hypothetical protein